MRLSKGSTILAGVFALTTVAGIAWQMPGITAQGRQEGLVPFQRDLTKELANKMKGTFVGAAVGDVLMQEPMGKMIDPAIQKILREATPPSATRRATCLIPAIGRMAMAAIGRRKSWPRTLPTSASIPLPPVKVMAARKE